MSSWVSCSQQVPPHRSKSTLGRLSVTCVSVVTWNKNELLAEGPVFPFCLGATRTVLQTGRMSSAVGALSGGDSCFLLRVSSLAGEQGEAEWGGQGEGVGFTPGSAEQPRTLTKFTITESAFGKVSCIYHFERLSRISRTTN